jgi:hypothetical protein
MGYAEARIGPLSLYGDIVYAPLRIDAGGARTIGPVSLGATVGVDIEQTVVEGGAIYEIARWSAFGGSTAMDLLAGARYWHQEAAIHLALTGTLDTAGLVVTRDRAIARAGSVDWVDPLVGLRLRHQLLPGHELMLRGDVGGFDAGSQFSWNVIAAYSMRVTSQQGITYSATLGYRALSVDYEKGSGSTRYEYDIIQHGPILGLTLNF